MGRDWIEIGLFAADALWNLLLVFPVLVIYWSGTWGLIDVYTEKCLPGRELLGYCVCIFIGSFLMIEAYFVLPLLRMFVVVSNRSVVHLVVSRTCIYVCALGGLFFWRGMWSVVVILMGVRLETSIAATVLALLMLVLLRCSSSPIGSPFSLAIDLRQDFYDVSPRFRQRIDRRLYSYSLDVLFTVFVLMTLNVIVWVGLWSLGDALILPNNKRLSMTVSLAAGVASTILMFAIWLPLDAAIVHVSKKISKTLAVVMEAVVNVVLVVVVLLLWRGLWGLMIDVLASAENSLMIAWICHSVGFIVMIGLQVGSTFGSVGCAVDGERRFSDWPMEYFIVFYRRRQEQRRNALEDRSVVSSSNGESFSERTDEEAALISSGIINEAPEALPSA